LPISPSHSRPLVDATITLTCIITSSPFITNWNKHQFAKSRNLGLIVFSKSEIRITAEPPPYPFSLYCTIHPLSELNSNPKFLPLQNPCIKVAVVWLIEYFWEGYTLAQCGIRVTLS
jgi:hypothetical protein